MDVSAVSAAVSGVDAGSAVAVSVLKSTETNLAQNIATLFSSIGLGNSISTFA
jgi:hypothetical protein